MANRSEEYFYFKNLFNVEIKKIYQFNTYYGWSMGGEPSEETHEEIIESAKVKAKSIFGIPNVYLIDPVMSLNNVYRQKVHDYPAFPKKTCIALLEHYESMHDENRDNSILTLVWFQNHFAFPIQQNILDTVSELNWREVSIDY